MSGTRMDELSSLDQILLAERKLNTWGGGTWGAGLPPVSLWILVCVPELPFGMGREAQTMGSAWSLPEPFHILLLSPAEEMSWVTPELGGNGKNSHLLLKKPAFCSWAAAEGGF